MNYREDKISIQLRSNYVENILIFTAAIIVVFALFTMVSSMIVAGRFDRQSDIENKKASDDIFSKKQICTRCKTEKDSYELDKHSENCPYIGCLSNGKCQFYVPLEKPSKTGIFKRNKSKTT